MKPSEESIKRNTNCIFGIGNAGFIETEIKCHNNKKELDTILLSSDPVMVSEGDQSNCISIFMTFDGDENPCSMDITIPEAIALIHNLKAHIKVIKSRGE